MSKNPTTNIHRVSPALAIAVAAVLALAAIAVVVLRSGGSPSSPVSSAPVTVAPVTTPSTSVPVTQTAAGCHRVIVAVTAFMKTTTSATVRTALEASRPTPFSALHAALYQQCAPNLLSPFIAGPYTTWWTGVPTTPSTMPTASTPAPSPAPTPTPIGSPANNPTPQGAEPGSASNIPVIGSKCNPGLNGCN